MRWVRRWLERRPKRTVTVGTLIGAGPVWLTTELDQRLWLCFLSVAKSTGFAGMRSVAALVGWKEFSLGPLMLSQLLP